MRGHCPISSETSWELRLGLQSQKWKGNLHLLCPYDVPGPVPPNHGYSTQKQLETANCYHSRDDSITTYVVSTTASPSVQLPAGTLAWNVAAHLHAGACNSPWPSRSTREKSLRIHGFMRKAQILGIQAQCSRLHNSKNVNMYTNLRMAIENLNLFCNKNREKNWQSWMLWPKDLSM